MTSCCVLSHITVPCLRSSTSEHHFQTPGFVDRRVTDELCQRDSKGQHANLVISLQLLQVDRYPHHTLLWKLETSAWARTEGTGQQQQTTPPHVFLLQILGFVQLQRLLSALFSALLSALLSVLQHF